MTAGHLMAIALQPCTPHFSFIAKPLRSIAEKISLRVTEVGLKPQINAEGRGLEPIDLRPSALICGSIPPFGTPSSARGENRNSHRPSQPRFMRKLRHPMLALLSFVIHLLKGRKA